MQAASMRATLVFAAICGAAALDIDATPMGKVVKLLKGLQTKVEKQGQKEAVQYDKFACFCKANAGFKEDSIGKSKGKIKTLKADIKELKANIRGLNGEIGGLGMELSMLKRDAKKAVQKRRKDHKDYLAKAKDLSEAIASAKEAIENLEGSKKEMSGADVDLVQLKTVAFNVQVEESHDSVQEAVRLMQKTSKAIAAKPGSASAFKFQSNDIIAAINDLMKAFKKQKQKLDMDEGESLTMFNKKLSGLNMQQSFKTKEKKEKTVLAELKTAEKTDDDQTEDGENKDKIGDEAFLKTLIKNCKTKAKEWDQRSRARADEMTALAEAIATLEKGAVSRYSVNKKLNLLAPASVSNPIASVAPTVPASKRTKAAISFLQVGSVASAQTSAIHRLLSHLDGAADRLQSPILSAIALKVALKEDHFSNVRALIKDLIGKLAADAKAEASTKGFCDKEMKAATTNRDKAKMDIETQNGILARKSSLAEEKADDIVELSKQIAQLNKDVLEAEALRKSEKKDNMQAVGEAKAGGEAVRSALKTLKGFYGFVQAPKDSSRKGAGRDGKTVNDKAPKGFSGEYKGSGDDAKGILGILEVIHTDFVRTATETAKAEKEATADHKKFLTDSNKDIKAKSQDKAQAQKIKEAAEEAIVEAKDDMYDAKKLESSSDAELQKLSPMCVDAEETYEERVAKRQEEITAMREAKKIMDDWQK